MLIALRHRLVEVAPVARAEVAGDTRVAPAEVVGGRDVREEVEALIVAEVETGLDDPGGIDDQRRLAVRFPCLDQPGDGCVQAHSATPRISYAGGMPALIRSCSRTMPSMSASGRGGQPGT